MQSAESLDPPPADRRRDTGDSPPFIAGELSAGPWCKPQEQDGRASPVLPDDLVLWEILVRLPAKELLRCRAACRLWRSLTSGVDFLLAHHRRQPSLPLVEFLGRRKPVTDRVDIALDAFNLWRSPTERRPVLRFNDFNILGSYEVHASCDGLLLLSTRNDRFYYICNPTTRQWISLPNLTKCRVLGLYPHSSSSEYRIMYLNWKGVNLCYVLTVGSSTAPRCIGKCEENGSWYVLGDRSVLLHGCLHWFHRVEGKVVVFDTIGESFRWMNAPAHDNYWKTLQLFQIDGTLGLSRMNWSETMMELWMLQNYEAEVWLMKRQIEFPVAKMSSITDSSYFHAMVISANGEVLVYSIGRSNLFHCDSTCKLLQKFQWDGVFPRPTSKWFKESLVQHTFFQRKDGRRARKPCFFQGL